MGLGELVNEYADAWYNDLRNNVIGGTAHFLDEALLQGGLGNYVSEWLTQPGAKVDQAVNVLTGLANTYGAGFGSDVQVDPLRGLDFAAHNPFSTYMLGEGIAQAAAVPSRLLQAARSPEAALLAEKAGDLANAAVKGFGDDTGAVQFGRGGGKKLGDGSLFASYMSPRTKSLDPEPASFRGARYANSGYGYEVSKAGDARFSAFNARFKNGPYAGKTIEEVYQLDVKGYRERGLTNPLDAKGRLPANGKSVAQLEQEYTNLWREWAKENPDLMRELMQRAAENNFTLTDQFARSGRRSQARSLATLLSELNWGADWIDAPPVLPLGKYDGPAPVTRRVATPEEMRDISGLRRTADVPEGDPRFSSINRVAIVGGEGVTDIGMVEAALKRSGFSPTEIVSGGGIGADVLGENIARARGARIITKKTPLDIADSADGAVIIDDGSPRTAEIIERMRRADKPVFTLDPTTGEVQSLVTEAAPTPPSPPGMPPGASPTVGSMRLVGTRAGRGTPIGETSDIALRNFSDAVIVELRDPAREVITAGYTPQTAAETALLEKGFPVGDFNGKPIALTRDPDMVGPLRETTKEKILAAHQQGASFFVSDHPKADRPFIDFLNEIGGNYKILHLDKFPRYNPRLSESVSVGPSVPTAAIKPIIEGTVRDKPAYGVVDVYTGRAMPRFRASPLGNPFKPGPNMTTAEAVANYRRWLWDRYSEGMVGNRNAAFDEINRLAEMQRSGKQIRLQCWPHPGPCHTSAIAELVEVVRQSTDNPAVMQAHAAKLSADTAQAVAASSKAPREISIQSTAINPPLQKTAGGAPNRTLMDWMMRNMTPDEIRAAEASRGNPKGQWARLEQMAKELPEEDLPPASWFASRPGKERMARNSDLAGIISPARVGPGREFEWVGRSAGSYGKGNNGSNVLSGPMMVTQKAGKLRPMPEVIGDYRMWLDSEIGKGINGEYSRAYEEIRRLADRVRAGDDVKFLHANIQYEAPKAEVVKSAVMREVERLSRAGAPTARLKPSPPPAPPEPSRYAKRAARAAKKPAEPVFKPSEKGQRVGPLEPIQIIDTRDLFKKNAKGGKSPETSAQVKNLDYIGKRNPILKRESPLFKDINDPLWSPTAVRSFYDSGAQDFFSFGFEYETWLRKLLQQLEQGARSPEADALFTLIRKRQDGIPIRLGVLNKPGSWDYMQAEIIKHFLENVAKPNVDATEVPYFVSGLE